MYSSIGIENTVYCSCGAPNRRIVLTTLRRTQEKKYQTEPKNFKWNEYPSLQPCRIPIHGSMIFPDARAARHKERRREGQKESSRGANKERRSKLPDVWAGRKIWGGRGGETARRREGADEERRSEEEKEQSRREKRGQERRFGGARTESLPNTKEHQRKPKQTMEIQRKPQVLGKIIDNRYNGRNPNIKSEKTYQ